MRSGRLIKADNSLIRDFMGLYDAYDYHGRPDKFVFGTPKKTFAYAALKYHLSWDWLMPVVEKIHNVAPKNVQEINNESLSIFEFGSIAIPINEVYAAVVDFIRWYNNQPKELTSPPPEPKE